MTLRRLTGDLFVIILNFFKADTIFMKDVFHSKFNET